MIQNWTGILHPSENGVCMEQTHKRFTTRQRDLVVIRAKREKRCTTERWLLLPLAL
jgi:hypothetical protein